MKTKEKSYVGVKETLLYGVANGGQVMGYNLIRSQLTFYLVTVFGLPAQAVTTMILVLGIWDTINDPIMGSVVDRTKTRYGKLRPYLLFVPIPLGIATVLFFGGAQFLSGVESVSAKIAYATIAYFVWEFFYTIGDIPFWGLSAAISPSLSDRSRAISSARLISSIIGGIVYILIPIFIDLSRHNKISWSLAQVFLFMGIMAGTVGMILFSFAGIFTKERIVQNADKQPKLKDCFAYMFKNKELLLLVLSSVLGTVEGISDTFSQYYYTLSLGFASLSLVAGIPGTVMGFLAYTFIPALEKRWSSKGILIRVTISKAVITTIIFLIGCNYYQNPKVIVPLLALQSFFLSALTSIKMVIPTKMIGDTIDYMEYKTGERGEGMAFSLLTFISKLTGSFSTVIATAIFPLIGLEQVNKEMQLMAGANLDKTTFWLWGLVTAIPALLGLISLIPLIFYKLDGKKLETVRELLKVMREENIASSKVQNKE